MTAELDARKRAVLTAVVRDFIRHGEPIGSKTVVQHTGLGVSPATIRAEMAALEDAGFLAHPHRSAGRVPTDKGYRFFVDRMVEAGQGRLGEDEQALLDDLLGGAHDLEDLLRRATTVLSRLTRFAALVAAPQLDRSRLKHVELVPLAPTTVLAIAIADSGRVTKLVLELDGPASELDLARAGHAVNAAIDGLRAADAPAAVSGLAAGAPPELAGLLDAIADALRVGLVERGGTAQLFVGGTANIAAGHFAQLEEVKRVAETLEEQVVALEVLREALASGDPAVRIGGELPFDLGAVAVVAASYDAPGDAEGSVGVLGPTRMDYERTLAAVTAVAATLERALAGPERA